MTVTHIQFKDITPSNWAGGSTYQYCIFPENTLYSDRNFDIRISCATINVNQSDFTRFEGYRRHLVMLDNALKIVHNNIAKKFDSLEVFTFDSNDRITSFSKGTDFNIMLSKKHTGELVRIQEGKVISSAKLTMLFALTESMIHINNQDYLLAPKDLLIVDNEKSIELNLQEKFIVFEL